MKRFTTSLAATAFVVSAALATGGNALATPAYAVPEPWAIRAIESLAADHLIDGYPDRSFRGDRPRTRNDMAKLIVRALDTARRNGTSSLSSADRDGLQALIAGYQAELVLLGERVSSLDDALKPADQRSAAAHSLQLHGAFNGNAAFTQRTASSQTIAGTPADPFVNAYLTSPPNNDPFEHAPGPSNLLRTDSHFDPTYVVNSKLALSLPIRISSALGAFSNDQTFVVQPAIVINIAGSDSLRRLYVRGGQLDNLASSRMGLTYRAPDATQEGPGFQNFVQPYENGIEVGGVIRGRTHVQLSAGRIEQSYINTTYPSLTDTAGQNALSNYFLTVTPTRSSIVQTGAPSATAGPSRIDTYTAAAGPVGFVSLSTKAAVGTVYVAAVNGVVCNAAGGRVGGGACPIPIGSYYYIDTTNQVVFRAPLPVGSTVQIAYAGSNDNPGAYPRSDYSSQRFHFNARVNHQFGSAAGPELGLSLSRIIDAGNAGGLAFGPGFGAVSDTVTGLDARIPLPFAFAAGHAALFAEAAYSRFTPDLVNTRAITDSALVAGLRLGFGAARATVQYQAVGPDFLSGAPLRFLGPAPATFQFSRGAYMPQFFGFANNLAINQTFDRTISPACTASCTARNAALTYIAPVFNPFAASGPNFYSAYAPNSQGFSGTLGTALGNGLNVKFGLQHLQEMVPNGFGQQAYGPGFASNLRLKFDKVEGSLQTGIPLFNSRADISIMGSVEHLFRKDLTAYSYVPFNAPAGGPDASSAAALTTYLSRPGNTPVLFYPNYVDEFHTTLAPALTLPIASALVFGVAYNTQTYHGAYGTTFNQNVAQRKDQSLASLTFAFPKSPSSLGFYFTNQRYADSVLPSYNFSQNREDVNLTIRF